MREFCGRSRLIRHIKIGLQTNWEAQMRGRFLGFTGNREEGVISLEDGSRFSFNSGEFNGDIERLTPGTELDFVGESGIARQVFLIANSNPEKSKIVAGVLALFLGGFGVHKFYLGYGKEGTIMLLVFVFGFIFIGLPSLAVSLVAFVEGIIYLTKSDDEFYYRYVRNRTPWL
jgi:TM2 domain-containing membrane protein YozV